MFDESEEGRERVSGVMFCSGSEGLGGSHEMGREADEQREQSGRTGDFTEITGGQQLGSAARPPDPRTPARPRVRRTVTLASPYVFGCVCVCKSTAGHSPSTRL